MGALGDGTNQSSHPPPPDFSNKNIEEKEDVYNIIKK
jgi:hypothetical protein